MNEQVIKEFRETSGKPGGYFAKMKLLLLHTKGAKSGTERISPVAYTTDGDDLIVVASYGGGPQHPGWYFNLLADPQVTVEMGDETFAATAESVEPESERRRLYDAHAAVYPTFKDYEQKAAGRTIPVVRLKRV